MSKGNLFSLKSRAKSASSIADISKAMNLVASTKYRRSKFDLENIKEYAKELTAIAKAFPARNRYNGKALLIALYSDRGFCGSYNNLVTKKYEQFIESLQSLPHEVLVVGKRGHIQSDSTTEKISMDDKDLYKLAEELKQKMLKSYLQGTKIYLIYGRYNSFKVNPVVEEVSLKGYKGDKESNELFIASAEDVYRELLDKYIAAYIYRALVSAKTSEHYSRMLSMKTANDNAEELITSLKLEHNKARQAIITQEILEIVGGTH